MAHPVGLSLPDLLATFRRNGETGNKLFAGECQDGVNFAPG